MQVEKRSDFQFEISPIEFELIKKIWSKELWPGRVSAIESNSAIEPDLSILKSNMFTPATHLGSFMQGQCVGVLSGHPTRGAHFRTRGLWVAEEWRKKGVAKALLVSLEKTALSQACKIIWSMPRQSSWPAYQRLGFEKIREATGFEFGPHWIVQKKLIF